MAIITVSREYGCEARTLGRCLAESLAYSYVDKESILETVRNNGVMRGKLKKPVSASDFEDQGKTDNSFSCLSALERKIICEYALTENTVIIGRGSNYLLKDVPHALHVRLVSPIEERIKTIAQSFNIRPDLALRLILQSELDRSLYIRTVYGQDWADHRFYDVVFDMTQSTNKEIIERISDLILQKDKQITETGKDCLSKLALAAKIKANVLTTDEISITTLKVHHDGKHIVMNGIVQNTNDRKIVEVIARSAAGRVPLINKLLISC